MFITCMQSSFMKDIVHLVDITIPLLKIMISGIDTMMKPSDMLDKIWNQLRDPHKMLISCFIRSHMSIIITNTIVLKFINTMMISLLWKFSSTISQENIWITSKRITLKMIHSTHNLFSANLQMLHRRKKSKLLLTLLMTQIKRSQKQMQEAVKQANRNKINLYCKGYLRM